MQNIKKDENRTILVVEDELSLQKAIKIKLKLNNFIVLTARSVEEALEIIKQEKIIHFIWLDHYLIGEKNGLDFVAQLKLNKNTKKIPIFVVSNTVSHDKIGSYLSLGVKKYFTKANHSLADIIEDMKNFSE